MKRSTKFLFFLAASISLFLLQVSFAGAKTICIGQSAPLNWTASNVSSCTATYTSNGCLFTPQTPVNGSVSGSKTMSPSATCSATLTCSGGGVSASDTDTLTVDTTKTWNGTACVAPPTASISQNSDITLSQGLFSVTWGSTNATSCTVTYSGPTTPGTLSSGPTSGTASLSPQNTGTYTLTNTCVNGSLSASQSVNHKVVSGTVSGTTCTVTSGASTCNTNITWTVAGTSFATLWDNVSSTARQGGDSGGNLVDTLSYNATRTYYVRDGSASSGFLIESTSVTPECATNTTWNGSVCAGNTPSGSLTLSPTSCTIAVGASTCSTVYATWTTSNVSSAALVDRNVDSTLSTSLNRASPGLQVWVAYPSTTFDLKNTSTETTLDTDIATASCASGSTWDGSVCACPAGQTAVSGSCVANPVLRNEAVNYPNITFVCDNSANYTVVRNEGSFSRSGSTTSGATITVPITMEGNYTLTCISGELTDSATINYTQPIVTLAGMIITASPRTVNNNKNTTLSWSVLYPTNSCGLRAEVSCIGGHSLCSTEQLAAETALNSTLTNGTTDVNDPYGPGRNIQTAVKTIAPENNPSNDKALGKKTILLNYTTDFILDCGGSLIKKTRVNVASDNEG